LLDVSWIAPTTRVTAMSTLRGSLLGIGIGILICLGVSAYWLNVELDRALREPLRLQSRTNYLIEPGTNIARIARDLSARRILDRPVYLVWHARMSGKSASIKAGEYALSPGISAGEMLDLFVSGRVVQRSFTIVEGWTFRQLLGAVRNSTRLSNTLEDLSTESVMSRIGHPEEHPEGRFLPDTYHFPKGTTDREFLGRAYDAMAKHLRDAWDARDLGLPLQSPYEALILASIVEKETAVEEERARVAGVFLKRLGKGMRLQTDPTVIYGLGDAFDGNLRRRDLQRDTPYNTYTRKGLPPTPISNPGPASIDAVLHPYIDGSLYFVAKGDGSHHFSTTYEEHAAAVIKYQIKGRRAARRQGS
jgi:UPF0755 protein